MPSAASFLAIEVGGKQFHFLRLSFHATQELRISAQFLLKRGKKSAFGC
jgi:hypothetical protein